MSCCLTRSCFSGDWADASTPGPSAGAAGSAWVRVSQMAGRHRGTPGLASCPLKLLAGPRVQGKASESPGGGLSSVCRSGDGRICSAELEGGIFKFPLAEEPELE